MTETERANWTITDAGRRLVLRLLRFYLLILLLAGVGGFAAGFAAAMVIGPRIQGLW